jgi:hypothetical protein
MYSPPAGKRSAVSTFRGVPGQDGFVETFTSGMNVTPPLTEAAKNISWHRRSPLIVLRSLRASYQAIATTPSRFTAMEGVRV